MEFEQAFSGIKVLAIARIVSAPFAAYQLAHQCEQNHQEIHERWSVQLTPHMRTPYRITRYDDWRDFDVWKAIVTTYYAQHARRRAA